MSVEGTSHTTDVVLDFLQTVFRHSVIKYWYYKHHSCGHFCPPLSPDLNPCPSCEVSWKRSCSWRNHYSHRPERHVCPVVQGDFQRRVVSLKTLIHVSEALFNKIVIILNMCLTEGIFQEILDQDLHTL